MADAFTDGLAATLEEYDPEMAAMVLDEFKRGWQVDNVLAKTRQAKIAEATDRIEWAAIDGIGEVTMRLDPTAYHFWGQKLGYDCWKDPAFKREFLRDNPEARIRQRRRRSPGITVPENSTFSPRQSATGSNQSATTTTAQQPAGAATKATTRTTQPAPNPTTMARPGATGAAPLPGKGRIIFP